MPSNFWLIPFAWCLPVAAAAAPLTLPEAQQLALSAQPMLGISRAAGVAQREAAVAAQQLPDPRLKLALQNVPTDSFSLSEDFMTQRTIAIEQMVPGGNKRQLRGLRGEREAAQSDAEQVVAERTVRRDSALAWLDVYFLVQTELLLRELHDTARVSMEALAISYGADKASQADVLAGQSALNQLDDRIHDVLGQAARAKAMLARWIGAAAGRELALDFVLPRVAPADELVANAGSHPELKVYDKGIEVSETDVLLAREARRPDWSVELAYSKRGSAYADMVSLQLAFDLPVSPATRQDRETASKRALLERTRLQREDRLRSLTAEIKAEHALYLATSSRIATLESAALANARQRVAASRIAYQNARGSLAAVYEAQRAEVEIRLQLLTQRLELARSAVRLAYFSAAEVPQ